MQQPLKWQRTRRRIFSNIVIVLVSVILLLAIYFMIKSDHTPFRWCVATAYTGMILLAVTLLTGPINVLFNRKNPISTDIRRDIGFWSAVISIVHVVVGLQLHMGNMLYYFFRPVGEAKRLVLRWDEFGFANHTGLIATIIFILLLITSNDLSMRIFGAKRWKAVQYTNYLLFIMVVAHSIIYLVILKRSLPYSIAFAIVVVITMAFQLAGFCKIKYKSRKSLLSANRQ
ncbi:MAG: ferric reductase-like transmembrane domain-containing protein [Planctomycetota bacterium]|jgi:sulfoxide reductase heme-binding subunit YedZ